MYVGMNFAAAPWTGVLRLDFRLCRISKHYELGKVRSPFPNVMPTRAQPAVNLVTDRKWLVFRVCVYGALLVSQVEYRGGIIYLFLLLDL